jgi:hypothetical protein
MTDTLRPGFVGYDDDVHFVHYCACGRWGAFGVGYSPRTGELGTWYCLEHRPIPQSHDAPAVLPCDAAPPSPSVQAGDIPCDANGAPDLQMFVRVCNGYRNITPADWQEFDRLMELYQQRRASVIAMP